MLMFSKVSIKSFAYDLVDVFMFPTHDIQEIYQQYQVNLYQNLTDTDSTSMFFVFICDLKLVTWSQSSKYNFWCYDKK